MHKKTLFGLLILVLFALPLLSACAEEATPTPTSSTPTPTTSTPTPVVEAHWWDKFGTPQYGGTLTLATSRLGDQFDLVNPLTSNWYPYDNLFMYDLTIPRDEWSFKVRGYPPKSVGMMAETWEWPDAQTLVVHLRHGIKWHDRPPTNGREFTADDVVYHYDRMLGTGHGFTEPNAMMAHFLAPLASVSAEDEYTVTFKFKEATLLINSWTIVSDSDARNKIEPREFVELGKPSEWQSCCGTGPFMVTDFVSGNSLTLSKNPDYYLYDARYPDNLLPYLDTLKYIYILDKSTQMAALRTGQVDLVTDLDWQTAQTLGETNPELVISSRPNNSMTLEPRNDTEPFNDIRVRKALQLAIDIPTIAKTHYGGYVNSNPPGFMCADYKGWTLPYEEWSQELKDEYSYNPEKARELLAEAGYPGGFETNCYISTAGDTELLEILKSYLADIGVDMTINAMEGNALTSFLRAGLQDQMAVNGFWNNTSPVSIAFQDVTGPTSWAYAAPEEAAVYNDLYQQFARAPDEAAAQKLVLQAEDYLLRQHWAVVTSAGVKFDAVQPYVIGYSGEYLGSWHIWFYLGFWIDQGMKESMGD